MKILETRFINKLDVLTVLVLLNIGDGVEQWHKRDFEKGKEKEVLEGIENGTLKPAMWTDAQFVEVDYPFNVGLDPRTPEQIKEANDRQTAEVSAHINQVLETIKPHLLEVFGEKTREKYIAAALTGLLSSNGLTYASANKDKIIQLAQEYATDLMISESQPMHQFGQTEQIFDPTC